MKIKSLTRLVLPVIIIFASCQKDPDGSFVNNPPPATGNLVRMRQGVKTDTILLFSYDLSNRLHIIKDSTNNDSFEAVYDLNNRITSVIRKYDTTTEKAFFTYNAAGLLTQVDYSLGEKQIEVFEYVNDIPAKRLTYSERGIGGPIKLNSYVTYGFTDGNITNIKKYSSDGVLGDERVLTYGTELNPFKQYCFFNYDNSLGFYDIINFETYFCRNIFTGYTSTFNSPSEPRSAVYSFDSRQRPLKIISDYTDPGGRHHCTRQFFYN